MSNHNGLYTGIEGVIVAGDGLPSKVPGSRGLPSWHVHWDNGYRANFFEWALEII